MKTITIYGSEMWEVTERNRSRVCALVMEYSRLERVRNEEIKRLMQVEGSIIKIIENSSLGTVMYVECQRVDDQKRSDSGLPKNEESMVGPKDAGKIELGRQCNPVNDLVNFK